MLELPQAVLWLDDIERFLGAGGFTGAGISSILSVRRHRIVATMRSEEYSYFCGGSSRMVDATRSRETIRQGWEVLRLATRIDLPRPWSSDEVLRAQQTEPHDPRVLDALERVDRFGVAEYLAAGPQLLTAWQDAWAPGTHPRAAALVLAAVDARRAGIHRPLSLAVLTHAHESYLHMRGGCRLRPEPIDRAVEWATTPLHATSSLLIPSDDGHFIAFDYLIDAIDREPIPAGALEAFIDFGHPEELKDIGQVAWNWGRLDQAELAFERASATYVESRAYRGYVIGERDGQAGHDRFLQRCVEELAAELGWDHEDTIDMRSTVAWDTGYSQIRQSLHRLLELKVDAERAIGAFHPVTLNIRRGVAQRTGQLGELHEAACRYLRLVEDCIEHLDENERVTYASIFGYASYVGRASTPERAIELLNEFGAWMRTRRAPADMLMRLRFEYARKLCQAGQYALGLNEFESIVADQERMHGRLNIQTLSTRCEWLEHMADNGEGVRALQLAQDLLSEYRTSADPQPITEHQIRITVANIFGEIGDVTEAVRIFRELRLETTRWYGEDDRAVRTTDYRIRYWPALKQAREGDPSGAADELRCLSEDIMVSHGITWDLREKAVRELGVIRSSA